MDNYYLLRSVAIIPHSELIFLHGRFLSNSDYSIDYINASLRLSPALAYSVFDTLIVSYREYLIDLKKEYRRRTLIRRFDDQRQDSLMVSRMAVSPLSPENIFGQNIEKSGTLIRGFTIGTNRDLTLQSGLRLQLSGKIGDDIEIVAALTDDNSPIQPEGNTERLDELDKVYILMKHQNFQAQFGDYDLALRQGEFGNISRKLQGVSITGNYQDHSAFVMFASSRGKFATNSFPGLDAVQGPYLLSGNTGEKNIIVIAGSERVYINGEIVKRGEQNDYTIDYGNARVTFTPKRQITSASRIIVEFEYTDRLFSRNLFAAGISSSFLNNRLAVKFQYLREGDDQDSPIDISLSDSDKKILLSAGDDRVNAVRSGVIYSAPDSLNRHTGIYEKIDTLVSGRITTFYRYNPGSVFADYVITFSYTGEMNGNYTRTAPGKFLFVGDFKGSYDTVVYLPLPELKQMTQLTLSYQIPQMLSLNIDLSLSSVDKNRFSELNDDDNNGFAGNALVSIEPQEIDLGGINFGKFSGSYRHRLTQDKYIPFESFGDVEFNRLYNITNSSTALTELLQELNFNYYPYEGSMFSGLYGRVSRGDQYTSKRWNGKLESRFSRIGKAKYDLDFIDTKNNTYMSSWYRQNGEFSFEYDFIKTSLPFLAESKREKIGNSDSLLNSSVQYYEINPQINFNFSRQVALSFAYSLRNDRLPMLGVSYDESNSSGYSVGAEINAFSWLQSSLFLSKKDKRYSDQFKNTGRLDAQLILGRGIVRANPFQQFSGELFYEVSTQRTAKLDRVFVEVTKGYGNYHYVGDLNNNGVKDENEFEPAVFEGDYNLLTVPSDQLYPVIDLKCSGRLRYNFRNSIYADGLFKKIVDAFSFESYGRIEENSTEPDLKKIYLLQLSNFRQEKTTLRGVNGIQQYIYIFENDPSLSFRLYFNQNRSLTQYGFGTENYFKKEQSIRIRFAMVEEVTNQTDIGLETDRLTAKANPLRSHQIESSSFSTDFSYRPERNLEFGLRLKVIRASDYYPASPTIVDQNAIQIRCQMMLSNAGRLYAEVERIELILNNVQNNLPFELTNGNGVGKNFIGRLNFDYRIAANLQITTNYESRSISGGKFIHTARAEVRAFF